MDKHYPVLGVELTRELEGHMKPWRLELQQLLPSATNDLEIIWDNTHLIPDSGTGGAALTRHKVALAFDPAFKGDKNQQLVNLKGSYFHEAFHTAQGWTYEDTPGKSISAIDEAIYEGAATVFERQRAGTKPLWGKPEDEQTMIAWFEELRRLPSEYDAQKYKFYDPETDRRWIMYRVGVFIIDRALRQNPELKIEDLVTKKPDEILALSEL